MNKKYLLTITVLSAISVFSHCNTLAQEKPDVPQHLTEDSITRLRLYIDLLSIPQLEKMKESYIYKNKISPTEQNKELLLYIEEKIRIKKEKQ